MNRGMIRSVGVGLLVVLSMFFTGCDGGGGGDAAPSVDVTGRWSGSSSEGFPFQFNLQQSGASIGGTTTAGGDTASVAGSVTGNRVEFTILWPDTGETVRADVTGNAMAGTIRQGDMEVSFSARRS